MKKSSSLALVIIIGLFVGRVNGSLLIHITEDARGNSLIQLIATGTISANEGSGSVINVVTSEDTFISSSIYDLHVIDNEVAPGITLGGASTNRIFVSDLNGHLGALPGGANSRIGFGMFTSEFSTGDLASDLNGIYSTVIPFSAFVAGTYNAVLGFPNSPTALIDIGEITVHVVPEPSTTGLLIGIGTLALALGRRLFRKNRLTEGVIVEWH